MSDQALMRTFVAHHEEYSRLQITPKNLEIVKYVAENYHAKSSEVAIAVSITPRSASTRLAMLVKRGWLRRFWANLRGEYRYSITFK